MPVVVPRFGVRSRCCSTVLPWLLVLGCLPAMAGEGAASTVADLVHVGLANDPAVAAAMAQARAAEQRVTQARAAFGPTAVLTGSVAGTRYFEAPAYELRPFHAEQAALQVTMPLWRGTLFPALRSARAQFEQARATFAQAQAESAQRVIDAAFEVLKARDVRALGQAQRMAAAEQLLAARKALAVGGVPVTDVRDAEARADLIAAQALAAESDLAMRQQVLAELAGRHAPELLGRGLDGTSLPVLEPEGVQQWLDDAAAGSPLMAQAKLALESSEHEVRKSWMAHAPTADATYTYAISHDTGTFTSALPRSGSSQAVALSINVPLFASGATQARVRETEALRDKSQADIDAARRTVFLAVRQAFSATVGAVAQARGLEAAVRSQEAALLANRRGFEVGVKVNAEVLEAQSRLFEARRDLSRARYDAWNGWIRLKALAGQLGDGDLKALDALLVSVGPSDLVGAKRAQP